MAAKTPTRAQQVGLCRIAGEALGGESPTRPVTWQALHRAGWTTGPTQDATLTEAGSREVQKIWDRQEAWR
jgi:hypothetical protein